MRYLAKCTSDIRDKYTSATTSRSNGLLLGNTDHLSQTDKGLRVTMNESLAFVQKSAR